MKLGFYKQSLKKRIQVLYIFLAILCISVTGVGSYLFAERSIQGSALELKQGILNKSVQVMDEHLRHIVVSSYSLMLGESFGQAMKDVSNNNTSHYYQNLSLLQTSFDQLKLVEPLIDATYLSTPIGDFYSTKDFPDRKTNFMEKYGSYLERPGWNTLWLGAHQSELFQSKGRVLSLLLKPTVIDNHNFPNVYMVVNMKEEAMRSILEQDLMNNQVQLFLLQKDGSMVIRPETQTYAFNTEHNFVSRFNQGTAGDFNYINAKGEELLVNYSTLSMNEDWVMVSIQSKADLLKPLNQIRWLIFWIMLICTLVALALSNLLASALLKPLNKLQRLMVEVEYNDLDVRFQSRYEDEVSAVGHKFNRMLDQIQVLIQEVRTSEQEKRKSEVKALQAQVDPHFLYNTLNTIFWKSENGEKSDVSEMIVALSLLFRLGLNNGNDITTLQQEVQHVRQYLQLQQKCYENLFTYTIEVEDDAYLSVRMLKILLQPLVENSILHGFRDKAELGRIEIRIYRSAGFLILRVTDNGCGMDAAALANAVNGTEAERRGYALSNLRSRLSLHYGESASIAFSSIPDIATTVTVTIPIL
ncbi:MULTISPECIES: histidine kinase [unclassified Paenibacillus]|uniref:sensor histidine kinase n=1 Tax=unclassified Paenibacillus TaxID=185978 RepID=UPI0003E1DF81|nr:MULTISPECIES: histidine kinase [unclassified Paenibacillus]ETT56744.1 integral membrane sensor signal transduction histidine kinase [Paenibacillus sp. FSL R7-269]OMG00312.1 two-component sensor histidine kinase [Paenibacillus sp. FSL R7-0337]